MINDELSGQGDIVFDRAVIDAQLIVNCSVTGSRFMFVSVTEAEISGYGAFVLWLGLVYERENSHRYILLTTNYYRFNGQN